MNWNGERAIGFVVGAAVTISIVAVIITRDPMASAGGFMVLIVGLVAPRIKDKKP